MLFFVSVLYQYFLPVRSLVYGPTQYVSTLTVFNVVIARLSLWGTGLYFSGQLKALSFVSVLCQYFFPVRSLVYGPTQYVSSLIFFTAKVEAAA